MDATHVAYHRSKGKYGPDFDTFSKRRKDLRALYAVQDRAAGLAPRLATALRGAVLESDDPATWTGRLQAAWTGARDADVQRLWIAFLEGGPEPDVAAVNDARLAFPTRAEAALAGTRRRRRSRRCGCC